MSTLWDQDRLQSYIDNQIEESLTLDYKAADALLKQDGKKKEISKDVAAFANSTGGMIIYGIKEYSEDDRKHLPEKIDPIDRKQYSKEWLEQIINSNIRPRIEGITIHPVQLNDDPTQVAYVVEIPKSITAHQAADHKYYKRYNFLSIPMEDYEIQDVRNRRRTVTPLVKFSIDVERHPLICLVVSNPGNVIAKDVKFNFLTPLIWKDNRAIPRLLEDGTKFLSPGDTYRFYYQPVRAVADGKVPSNIDVEVSYFHAEIGERISETFHIELRNYLDTLVTQTEISQLSEIKTSVQSLVNEISKANQYLNSISNIASVTGLQLSTPTLRNLQLISQQSSELEKLEPKGQDYKFFMEVLGIDADLATNLHLFYLQDLPGPLEDIEGISAELIQKIKSTFK